MKKYRTPEIHPAIKHLSQEQIKELIYEFYNSGRSTHLIDKYHIDYPSAHLHKVLPPKVMKDQYCIYCNVPMWRERSKKRSSPGTLYYCPECGHKNHSFDCKCKFCKQERKKNKKYEGYTRPYLFDTEIDFMDMDVKRDIKSLTFLERVFLGTLLRVSDHQNYETFKFKKKKWYLRPNSCWLNDIIDLLVIRKIIAHEIDFSNKEDPFDLTIDDTPTDEYNFYILLSDKLTDEQIYEKLAFSEFDDVPIKDFQEMWQYLAIEECIGIVESQYKQQNVKFDMVDIVRNRIKEMLLNYSVCQFFYIFNYLFKIKREECKDLKITKEKILMDIIKDVSVYFQRAISEGYDIPNELSDSLSFSELSKFYFNDVLNLKQDALLLSPYSHCLTESDIKPPYPKTMNNPTPEDLLEKGEELFGSKKKFDLWMNYPNTIFGETKPYHLMFESGGIKRIYHELIRFEFGIFR